MKILYLTQILSPSIGGGELVFFNLAKGMLKLGHRVHIICHKKRNINSNSIEAPNFGIQEIERMGGIIHYVKPEEKNDGKTSSSRTIFAAFNFHIGYIINALRVANDLYRQGEIDIIHANMYTPVIPASLFGRLRRIPVVMTLHNPTIDTWKQWSLQKGVPKSSAFLGPLYEKMLLRLPVTVVHVVSRKVRDELRLINPNAKAVLIYNGIEIEEDFDTQSEIQYNKYVLYMGRLVAGKNLQTVILAFKKVNQLMPDAKLIVAGDGPLRQQWQELVDSNDLRNNIFFLGHVSNRKNKYELLTKTSAVVFPSTSEGFAMVPIEAFQMSKPLLISKIRPSDEIVDDNVDGFLLPPNDPDKWADKILFLLNNPKICKEMGSKGRLKVSETFNMTAVSNNMERLYETLISKGA
ncbi:MAG TPA: glycosyltransferase family 4 protein [Candidatus Saccharimonadales bacterium]|nr:glycosyltransferase family 4 protein [Candidatus Saccharimonadales bacterium]